MGRELTVRYAALCQHYGMQDMHNYTVRGHGNGSIESAPSETTAAAS